MRAIKTVVLILVVITAAAAQTPDPMLSDTRLSVHTLVREDIFAGFMDNRMNRLEIGEQNIEILLKQRPDQRANLLAWKGGATLYRAVVAHEAGKADAFAPLFKEARGLFGEALKTMSPRDGVPAIVGGSFAVFADRLPAEHRAEAWEQAYNAYSMLWKVQGAGVADMPVHFKGELLSGLAQSAQRTGRMEEMTTYLDTMLEVLPNTPYVAAAKQWKADPSSAATVSLTCKNCHNPGRLASRLKALGSPQ